MWLSNKFSNHSLQVTSLKGGKREREQGLFFVMPEIFHQILQRHGGQVGLKSGGLRNKPSTLPPIRLFLNSSLGITPWLSALYTADCGLPPASWGFYSPCLFTMFGTILFVLVLRWALLGETVQFYKYTYTYPHTHSSYYQVQYVASNWSELIYVLTASGRYNLLWVSNNLNNFVRMNSGWFDLTTWESI